MRARDLGIAIGTGTPGPFNAITDVPGVRVGHTTLIRGDGPLVVGEGPVRTGVTVIVPHDGDIWMEPLFAGTHTLNGNGELTGLEWIREAGMLGGAIGLTNTHSVGAVHDALVRRAAAAHGPSELFWSLPVVGETYDGTLNDINGFHVRAEHVFAALDVATGGPVAEGAVGGGTGMICHEFKGGIGTASRELPESSGGWTVGVLVQANYGRRELLRVDGVPVGREIPKDEVPSLFPDRGSAAGGSVPGGSAAGGSAAAGSVAAGPGQPGRAGAGGGSIIIVVATDAPLLPHQCRRVAQRAGLGLARTGSIASTSSGDLFLAFATGNRGLPAAEGVVRAVTHDARFVLEHALDPIFEATVEATEEAIVNALVAAVTVTGRDGLTAHALPHDRLVEVMRRHGRHVS